MQSLVRANIDPEVSPSMPSWVYMYLYAAVLSLLCSKYTYMCIERFYAIYRW